jgi:hypothetical protein
MAEGENNLFEWMARLEAIVDYLTSFDVNQVSVSSYLPL